MVDISDGIAELKVDSKPDIGLKSFSVKPTVSAEIQAMADEAGIDTVAVIGRVNFDMALKRVQGNHFSFDTLEFKNVALSSDPERIKRLAEALKDNTTCTALDLSESGLTDSALQQLAATLAVASRLPKLKKLILGPGNPGLGNVGQTVAQGLCHLRPGLELSFGEGAAPKVSGFVHQKELVEGITAWWNGDIAVVGENQCFYCPDEVLAYAGVKPGGERLRLTKGFQGPNGTKYRCDHATFELYSATGNMVLLTLKKNEGVVV